MKKIELGVEEILTSELKLNIVQKPITIIAVDVDNNIIYTEKNVKEEDREIIITQWKIIPKTLRNSVRNVYVGLEPLPHLRTYSHTLIKKEFEKRDIYIPANTTGNINIIKEIENETKNKNEEEIIKIKNEKLKHILLHEIAHILNPLFKK